MNTYDLKCYEKTYHDSQYWEQVKYDSDAQKHQLWANCRSLTDAFHNELIHRGYLLPKSTHNT